jgi:1-acyl-sn-glycerol-3-phosphate acyltransferase
MKPSAEYEAVLRRGREIHPGVHLGRPGRGWAYWPMFALAQAVRLRWTITVSGRDNIEPGPAILIGNHVSAMDPVMVGITTIGHMAFFTKIEAYESAGGAFFSGVGQIPLRRGDEASTTWALDMSAEVVRMGTKLCLYPEGTRSPDGRTMHRLHRRVLVPILQANPDVPVHVMSIAYPGRRRGRDMVDLRFSPALALDVTHQTANDLTDAVTTALLDLGGMPYVHTFGRRLTGE